MKKLTIMRHGKAEPRGQPGIEDKDRELVDRGLEDASQVGKFYAAMIPDLIISSPAVRALETARLFAEGAGYSKDIMVDDRDLIYNGIGSSSVDDLMTLIRDQEDDHIMIVGHNNGVSDLIAHLDGRDGKTIVANPLLVTAATAHIAFKGLDDWLALQPESGQMWALISPRFIKKLSG
ncbi:MAG: SixA phosphatase family protein [Candidatus Promineifilaceae bacterium]|jgi:phosphohistidine phosphatase